jgi:hypothetical protein
VSTLDRADRESGAAAESEADHESPSSNAGEMVRMRAMHRRWVQRKASGGGGGAAAIPESGGAPLGGEVKGRMERTLGADLSGARVHTGGESAEAAESMGARAFTVGGDVHFGRGEFAPGSKEGDRLLAHELAHVVQGQKSGVQRKPDAHGPADQGEHGDHEAGGHEVSEPGDPAEQEADAAGDHAADALHGDKKKDKKKGGDGKDKGGDHAAAHGAEEKEGDAGGGAGGEAHGDEKPKLGASAAGVSRKIFRAKTPGKPPPTPADAKAGKPGAKGKGPQGQGAAPAKSPEETEAETWCAGELPKLQAYKPSTATDFKVVDMFESKLSPLLAKFKTNQALLDAKKALTDKKAEIEDACIVDLTIHVTAALKGLPRNEPGSYAKAGALTARLSKWKKYFVDAKDGAAGYGAVHDAEKDIADAQAAVLKERETVLQTALDGIGAVEPDKPDASKKLDAAAKAAEPWVAAKGLPADAKAGKIGELKEQKLQQIQEATKAREQREKDEQAKKQKQDQEKQKQTQAQPGAAPAGEKKKSQGEDKKAETPTAQPPAAAKPSATPHPAPAPGGASTPTAAPAHAPDPAAAGAAPAQAHAGGGDAKHEGGQHDPKQAAHAPGAHPEHDEAHKLEEEKHELEKEQLETEMELACAEFVKSVATGNAWLSAFIDLGGLLVPILHGVGMAKSIGVVGTIVKAELDAKWLTHAVKQLAPAEIQSSLDTLAGKEQSFGQIKAMIEEFLKHDPARMAAAKKDQAQADDKKAVAKGAAKSEGPEVGTEGAGIMVHALHHAIEHGLGPVLGEVAGKAAEVLPFVATAFGIRSARAAGQKVFDLKAKLINLQGAAEEKGAKTGRKFV